MPPRKLHLTTFGCQMNVDDSQRLAWLLAGRGFETAAEAESADLIVINTCSVRAKAEQKAFSLLGRLKKLKAARPDLIIVLAGCLAQQEGGRLLGRFSHLDAVIGTGAMGRLPDLVARAAAGERVVDIGLDRELPGRLENALKGVGVRSQVTIMAGCNNFCAYCVVPRLRGRERSRPPAEILAEVEAKVSAGAREINLLGQNVNSYHYGDWDFVSLLEAVSRIQGLIHLRFTTSHPKDLNRRLIASFGELKNLCPALHLPFQAGSDRILKKMNRGYRRADYLALVTSLRAVRPRIALSTDVIVGFPGESEADFAQTMDLIERVRFDSFFSFRYSDRPHTAAADFPEKVSQEAASRRLVRLQARQAEISLAYNRLLAGRTVGVLVEGPAKRGELLTGRTSANKVVNLPGPADLIGRLVPVQITAAGTNSLLGRPREDKIRIYSQRGERK